MFFKSFYNIQKIMYFYKKGVDCQPGSIVAV